MFRLSSSCPAACLAVLVGAVALLAGCGADAATSADAPVAAPLRGVENAYAHAKARTATIDTPRAYEGGLSNVIRLSPQVLSGSEPLEESAFKRLAALGVKTILCVDGKAPDVATAQRHGLRYVHVPIQYSGMEPGELARIAKTFRELPGPFYVHCFHGKHRGPAAAAVGRLVLDGASREQVLGEMVACGTSGTYEGLYRVIASGDMPSAQLTASLAWPFEASHAFRGVRGGMVVMTRPYDNLELMQAGGFVVDPEHPDVDPVNEAAAVVQHVRRMAALPEVTGKPADYRAWMQAMVEAADSFHAALAAGDPSEAGRAETSRRFDVLAQTCADCHKPYRNLRPNP
ncbi:MAG: hypothetical protein O2894_05840 [Planctomycetota bacterium]|nr:hypothetical protein [Planctomycetota bacterium]